MPVILLVIVFSAVVWALALIGALAAAEWLTTILF